MATRKLLELDLTNGSVQVESTLNEWGELDFEVFIVDTKGRKYQFVGCNSEQKVYCTIVSADNYCLMFNKALYKWNESLEDYEFVLLPKGYSEKEITTVCTEFVDTMN